MKKQYWYSRGSRSSPATPRPRQPAHLHVDANPGCMSMVHYLIFAPGAGCLARPPPSHGVAAAANSNDDVNSCTRSSSHNDKIYNAGGLEAPRNSLELDADQLKDIQIGVQIEPAFDALAQSARAAAPSTSEAETPRTPSLVARLMGIDGLPADQSSPSLTNKNPAVVKEKKKRVILESMNRQPLRSLSCNVPAGEARSLPDTPRASASSTARAASWDVLVDRPRLSLQVLKENVLDRAAHYVSMPTSPTSCGAAKKKKLRDGHRRRDAEMKTKEEHARDIVRQAKETITNRKSAAGKKTATSITSSNKENATPLLEFQAAPGKPTAPPQLNAQADQQPHAPRLPPPPQRAKPSRPPPPPPPPPPLDPPPSRVVLVVPQPQPQPPPPPQAVKCKRPPDGCERFATRIKKPAATSQQAPVAMASPPPTAAAPVSSSANRVACTSTTVPVEEDPEYRYLRTVLERGGFMRATPSRPFKGHSVAAPVDPIIFHLLELDLPADEARLGPLRHRWNRKLLFHLAQETLADLLLGLDCAAPGTAPALAGPPLLGTLWRKARSFPAADCKVVGDIDALVATDLRAASVRGLARHPAVAEEAGDVADEVAERVLDALLGECAAESLPLSSSPSSCGRSSSPARAPR